MSKTKTTNRLARVALWVVSMAASAILWPVPGLGQSSPGAPPPDCQFFATITTASPVSINFDNRTAGCVSWRVAYVSNGFATITLAFQSADDSNGTPGAFATFTGTVTGGINPNTSTTNASTTFSGYVPWVRLNLTAFTGAGSIRAVVYGSKSTLPGGGSSTVTVLQGTDPWIVGGRDSGGVAETIITNTEGVLGVAQSGVSLDGQSTQGALLVTPGASSAANRAALVNYPYQYDGTNNAWDRDFSCTGSVAVSVSGAGNTELVAAAVAKKVRICHVSLTAAGPVDIKFTNGTGVNCGTGTADLTGLYRSTLTLALDLYEKAALRTGTGNALCINLSGAVAVSGLLMYDQH